MANLVPDPRNDNSQSIDAIPYPSSPDEHSGNLDELISVREVLGVLRRNIWLLLLFMIAMGAAAAFVALKQPNQYRAAAVIRLRDERQSLTGGIESQSMEKVLGSSVDPLLSELQVLRSRTLAERIVDSTALRLVSATERFSPADLSNVMLAPSLADDTIRIHFGQSAFTLAVGRFASQAPYGQPASAGGVTLAVPSKPTVSDAELEITSRAKAVQKVLGYLTTRQVEKTNIVQVEFTDHDPRMAQLVANTAISAFQTTNAAESQQQSRRRRLFLEEQLTKTDSALAAAQLHLSDFRRREEVYSSREKFVAQQSGLLQLQERREEYDSDRRIYQGIVNTLKTSRGDNTATLRALVSTPTSSTSPLVTQLYSQLLQYQIAKDSLTAGPHGSAAQSPEVQRLNTLIVGTERRLMDAAQSYVSGLDARIASLDDLMARNATNIQALPDKEAEEMRLVLSVETTRKLADQLREEYQKARIAEAVEVGKVEIVDRASAPSNPIGTGRSTKIAFGLLLGLVLGGGLAFIREHMNTKIQRKDEVEALLRIPALAVIPRIQKENGRAAPRLRLPLFSRGSTLARPSDQLVTLANGTSSGAEAYRNLRTNLLFSQVSAQSLRKVLITSALAAEGKTTTAANLAVTFAQQGKRVVLVDGDLRKARVHHIFGVTRQPGFVDVIAGLSTLEESVRSAGVENLFVLTAGPLPPNPSEMLGSAKTLEILDSLSKSFDIVIIDAPPVLVAGDASILAAHADMALLVVRAGQTERAVAKAALQQLQGVGARVVGAVLNDPDAQMPSYEGYYYYAYSYYGERA